MQNLHGFTVAHDFVGQLLILTVLISVNIYVNFCYRHSESEKLLQQIVDTSYKGLKRARCVRIVAAFIVFLFEKKTNSCILLLVNIGLTNICPVCCLHYLCCARLEPPFYIQSCCCAHNVAR